MLDPNGIVVQALEQAEERAGDDGAEKRAQPVDPVVAREVEAGDARPETAGGVDGGAGEEEA